MNVHRVIAIGCAIGSGVATGLAVAHRAPFWTAYSVAVLAAALVVAFDTSPAKENQE